MQQTGGRAAARPRVHFVDDDEQLLAGLRRSLRGRAEGWDMVWSTDPREALAALIAAPPAVAVLDLRMPGLSGIDLAARLREVAPDTAIVILSGTTDFDVAVSTINLAHVFRYLVKPCDTADLTASIEAALAQRRAVEGGAGRGALELIPHGVIAVGASGQALFANGRAGRLMAAGGGLRMDGSGIICAARPEDTRRLHAALAQARDGGVVSALTLEGRDGAVLRLTVQPGACAAGGDGPAPPVCIFAFSPDDLAAPEPRLLEEMFGLTASEARLAAALAHGQPLEAAAEACGLTRSTARTYLKTIFGKLGVTRQAELVRTVLVSLAK